MDYTMKQWKTSGLAVLVMTALLTGCQQQEEYTGAADDPVMVIEVSEVPEVIELEMGEEAELLMQHTSVAEARQSGLSLLFAGDVLLSNHVLQAYQKAGGISGVLDEGYRLQIGQADFFMVNEEFPFSSRGVAAADKQYTFRLAPEWVSILQEMGVDGVTLANNHALDFGQEALLDTCEVLDQAGILHTGAGVNLAAAKEPVIMEKNGIRVGIIGTTRVIPVAGWAAGNSHPGMLSTYDPTVVLAEIEELKEYCDFVVVMVHWGIERDEKPQEYQRTLGKQYIDAGADLVVGSHPHVLQGIEFYDGKPIVYSLGNFVFGSSIPRTMLFQVSLSADSGQMNYRLLPGTSSAGYTRMLTDAGKLQEFYQYMEQISFGVTFDEQGGIQSGSSE